MSARNIIILFVLLAVALFVFRQSKSSAALKVTKSEQRETSTDKPALLAGKTGDTHDKDLPSNKKIKKPASPKDIDKSLAPGSVKAVKNSSEIAGVTGDSDIQPADAMGEVGEFEVPEASRYRSMPFLEVLEGADSAKASALEELLINPSEQGLARLATLCDQQEDICKANQIAIFRAVNRLDVSQKEDFARENRGQYSSAFVKGLIADIETNAKAREQALESPRVIEMPQPDLHN